MKFHGELDELQQYVKFAGREGDWSDDGKGCHRFRSRSGDILNWWPKTGTVSCQGKRADALAADLTRIIGEKANFEAKASSNVRRIFIVHGSDHEALEQLELVLFRLGIEPLIQKNVDGKGLPLFHALMENIGNESDFVFVLMTPDDYGYRKDQNDTERQPRARQNVILEAGMALSKLGSDRVALIKKGTLELPSDLEGIIRVEYNTHVKEVAAKIAQRLTGAGIPIAESRVISASQ
ncbi:nucleotide-binding protein [Methylocystis sp. 9N]|uniref:Nucleotide-binding protein n=1 Tax=Methylocystis borbori TaxID=3118750 RepID=A0ABU7XG79_9HYPH